MKPINDYINVKEAVEEAKKALPKIMMQFEAQDNVVVFIPATAFAQGYKIVCDIKTAQTKYSQYKHLKLPNYEGI